MKTIKTGVTLDMDLLEKLNAYMDKMGYRNRSRIINRAIEHFLSEKMELLHGGRGVGVLTLIYQHHAGNIEHKMTHIQHRYLDIVISNTHVHLDEENCLEVVIVKGDIARIRSMVSELERLKQIRVIRHDIHPIT